MSYPQKKGAPPDRTPEEIKRRLDKSRATPAEVDKALDKVVEKYRGAIKELARR